MFKNSPTMTADGSVTMKRYYHQPLEVEYNGILAKIQPNGKVLVSRPAGKDDDGTQLFDEVEIPAALIFKLSGLLRDTRKVEYVQVGSSLRSEPEANEK